MNSQQRKKELKQRMRLITIVGEMFTEQIEIWKKDPDISKEDIIKELEKISVGIKEIKKI